VALRVCPDSAREARTTKSAVTAATIPDLEILRSQELLFAGGVSGEGAGVRRTMEIGEKSGAKFKSNKAAHKCNAKRHVRITGWKCGMCRPAIAHLLWRLFPNDGLSEGIHCFLVTNKKRI